jgi:hypothetical protein
MRSGAVRIVLISLILTGGRPFSVLGFSCAKAGDESRLAPPAAAPVDKKRIASRRFMGIAFCNNEVAVIIGAFGNRQFKGDRDMSSMISPEIRELQQKQEDMRVELAKTQGEVSIIKHNSERNDRQTNKQFVAFFITMFLAVASCLIGTSIFQTDALRREMNVKFDAVNQRMDALDRRMEKLEKSIEELKEVIRDQKRTVSLPTRKAARPFLTSIPSQARRTEASAP